MTNDDVRSYSLSYHGRQPFFLDLCPDCLERRLEAGASVLDKRIIVSAPRCADCEAAQGRLR